MKLLSIFRAGADSGDVAPPKRAQDLSARVAELFGVPQAQLTPQVRAAFNALMGEVDALRTELADTRIALADAEASADHDTLAPVFNRRAFMREANRVVALVRRHEIAASLIFFDLNGFKQVNDLHGHAAGDKLLNSIGEMLMEQTRETDIVGRLGGDEFGVILTHVSHKAALAKAAQLAEAVSDWKLLPEGVTTTISTAFGVAEFSPADSAERVLARADEAMYADKAQTRKARA